MTTLCSLFSWQYFCARPAHLLYKKILSKWCSLKRPHNRNISVFGFIDFYPRGLTTSTLYGNIICVWIGQKYNAFSAQSYQICRSGRVHLNVRCAELRDEFRRENIFDGIVFLRFALDDH